MNVAVTDAKLMLLDLIAKRVNTALHQSNSIRFFDILITCWKMRNGMFCYSQIINYILIRTLKPAINGFNICSVFYLRMYTPKTEIQNKICGSICFFNATVYLMWPFRTEHAKRKQIAFSSIRFFYRNESLHQLQTSTI